MNTYTNTSIFILIFVFIDLKSFLHAFVYLYGEGKQLC